MALLKNSLIVAVWTAASRVLGFGRDLLIANKLGAGASADAFFIALQLPNLFRRLFGEGAFNVAFVPILARYRAEGDAAAVAYASAVFSWLLLVVSGVVVLGWLGMPVLMTVLASGWLDQPEKFNLAVHLGRITFPYLGLITIAAFLGALCNTFGKFAAYAMVPALLNLAIIASLFALPWSNLYPAEAAAWAVPLGGILQAAYMLWAAKRLGLTLRLQWLPQHRDLKTLLLRMGPACLGVGVLQLSLIVDNQVASWLDDGAIAFLQYANRFYQFPLALIGIAVATVLLPHLAVLLGQGDKVAASRSFTRALGGCMALALGATVGLLFLAAPMLDVLLRHGAFDAWAAQATAWAMIGYVIGLPAYILTKVTSPAFFAAEDPMSPVKASGIALLVNFALNVVFAVAMVQLGYGAMAHVGIAVATAIGGYVNAGLQFSWLQKKGVLHLDWAELRRPLGLMLLVSGAMALALVGFRLAWTYPTEAGLLLRASWLVSALGLGGVVFMVGLEMTKLLDVRMIWRNRKQRVALPGATTTSGADV
jgi:putative peptidoglycan lipid II flippase